MCRIFPSPAASKIYYIYCITRWWITSEVCGSKVNSQLYVAVQHFTSLLFFSEKKKKIKFARQKRVSLLVSVVMFTGLIHTTLYTLCSCSHTVDLLDGWLQLCYSRTTSPKLGTLSPGRRISIKALSFSFKFHLLKLVPQSVLGFWDCYLPWMFTTGFMNG